MKHFHVFEGEGCKQFSHVQEGGGHIFTITEHFNPHCTLTTPYKCVNLARLLKHAYLKENIKVLDIQLTSKLPGNLAIQKKYH